MLKRYGLYSLGLILTGLLTGFTILFISGMRPYFPYIVWLVLFYLVIVVFGVILQIVWQVASGPAYHNSKSRYYLTPLLFLVRKKKHWEIHGGQLYDFLYLRSKGMLSRECIQKYYDAQKAISAIAGLIKSGEVPSTDIIRISTHFISDNVMKKIQETVGIPYERVNVPKWQMLLNILLLYPIMTPDIILKYYLTNRRMPRWHIIRNIFRAPTYIIRLEYLAGTPDIQGPGNSQTAMPVRSTER